MQTIAGQFGYPTHSSGHKESFSRSRRFRLFGPTSRLATLAGCLLMAGCSHTTTETPCATSAAQVSSVAAPSRPWFEFGMADPVLNQVVLFYLGEVWHQSTDVGEVLETASRVKANDPYSWPREWQKTAERVGKVATNSENSGQSLAASHSYLRAASYFRAALHRYPNPKDPEVAQWTRQEVSAFEKYMKLSGRDAVSVQIPYEGTTLHGYFFRSGKAKDRAPVVIAHQGRDAWAEDNKHVADAANERGYHALLFDGPGMGKTLRLQGLPFRADWEKVITPVVDYLATRPDTDMSRTALIGISMGGYLAVRAATVEHRLKLVVANPGVLDWSKVVLSFLDGIDPQLRDLLETDPAAFESRMQARMQANDFLRWAMLDSMWRHGANSPLTLMREFKRYQMGDAINNIRSRMLVIDGESEEYGEAKPLFDALRSPKDYLMFSAADTAQFHVQVGALALSTQRIFEWISREL